MPRKWALAILALLILLTLSSDPQSSILLAQIRRQRGDQLLQLLQDGQQMAKEFISEFSTDYDNSSKNGSSSLSSILFGKEFFNKSKATTVPAVPLNRTDSEWRDLAEIDQPLDPKPLILWPKLRSNLSLIVFVHVKSDGFDRRNEWRNTYGKFMEKFNFDLIFTIGRSLNASITETIRNESNIYSDILQGDFIDTYYNITHKQLMHLRFAAQNCSNVPFFLKIDDDLVWNVRLVLDFISRSNPEINGVHCYIWHHQAIQRGQKKWAVSKKRLPEEFYPDFCSGIGYILTRTAVRALVDAIRLAKWFWVDDVFITGFLADMAQTKRIEINKLFELDTRKSDKLSRGEVLFSLTYRPKFREWFQIGNCIHNNTSDNKAYNC